MADPDPSGQLDQSAGLLGCVFDDLQHAADSRPNLPTVSTAYVGASSVGKSYKAGMETLGARIRLARKAAGFTQKALAEHFSIARVNVTQWESDTTRPDGYRLPEIARLLNVSEEWLREAKGGGPSGGATPKPRRRPDTFRPQIVPGDELVSQQTMPLYAAAMGGEGHLIVSFEEIDRIKRPAELENVKGGYGLLVVGDSMVPAYRPGDMALVHPHKPPARDTDVILYHVPPTGEDEAMIKRLVGINDREWTLEQYNPYREFKEFRKEWQVCHRVVGKYHAR